MEEELDVNWINEIDDIEKNNDIFYKEKINEIAIIFIYVNNNETEYIKKDFIELDTPGLLEKEKLLKLINDNKINNSIKYNLTSLLKFNIDLEPENIKNFTIDKNIDQNIYFKKIKTVDTIYWNDAISMFESLNTLFFIYTKKKSDPSSNHSNTKRVIFKKNNTTRKKI